MQCDCLSFKKTFKESYFYAPAWTAAGLTLGTIPAEREKMFIASWCDQLRLVPYLGACEKTNKLFSLQNFDPCSISGHVQAGLRC